MQIRSIFNTYNYQLIIFQVTKIYMKKIFIIIFFINFFASKPLAANPEFSLKESGGALYFEINMPKDYSIYANPDIVKIGMPTKIDIIKTENIKNYKLVWPVPKQKYIEKIGKIYFYEKKLIVPLNLDIINSDEPVYLEAQIDYALCKDRCNIISQKLSLSTRLTENFFDIVKNYALLITLSILGGAVINFMPCVLPILSLKILSFLKNKHLKVNIACGATIAGIFTCFWGLALLMIILKAGGKELGLGINFQTPEFIIFLSFAMTMFISNALDRFNFSLPMNLFDKLSLTRPAREYLNHYLSGILATLLSTPCTAPFLGAAIFMAFSAGYFHIFLSFTFVALGFSLPYILMTINPNILNKLPKSGSWTIILKKILIVPLICTLFWLLYVLHSQIGSRATLGLFLLILLFKFLLESNVGILSSNLIKIIFIIIIISAGMTLPMYAYKEDENRDNEINSVRRDFNVDAIKQQISEGNIVFVGITADWCLTCKYNNLTVLDRNKTFALFKNYNVYVMIGDLTTHNQEIYNFMKANGSYGIPFYKIYSPKYPEGITLPVIITYADLKSVLQEVK